MSFNMKSKTKIKVSNEEIKKIIQYHFHQNTIEIKEIVSGFYNAVYYIRTSDKELVLKIAPSSDIDILTYEKNILKREVKVYQLLESLDVPVPKVIAKDYTKSIIDSDYYIMNYIEGDTLFELKDTNISKESIYLKLMDYLVRIHSCKMNSFGYDNFDDKVDSLNEAYFKMINNLLEDATRAKLVLPDYVNDLIKLTRQQESYLNYNEKPSLLHFDLWDGNIYIRDGEIISLIDTERSLNFEPMMEFVAMHMDIFEMKNRKYIERYNKFAREKIVLDNDSLIRFRMYQVYMYLLIVVECPYRDIKGSFNDQMTWGLNELKKLYEFFIKIK